MRNMINQLHVLEICRENNNDFMKTMSMMMRQWLWPRGDDPDDNKITMTMTQFEIIPFSFMKKYFFSVP